MKDAALREGFPIPGAGDLATALRRLDGAPAAFGTAAALAASMTSITRILVPTDFSETADAALAYAKTIAERFNAELSLAAEHEADAKLHEEIVTAARKDEASVGHAWELARGADHYAEHSREAAEALKDLAALHEGMAEAAPAKASTKR